MKAQDSYIEFLIEQFAPLGEITPRRMFGGHCLYCDGTVFALVSKNFLFLKADSVNKGEFEKYGSKPFRPKSHPKVTMAYYEAPAEIFEDQDAMKFWVGGAVEAGRRSAKTKRPRKR